MSLPVSYTTASLMQLTMTTLASMSTVNNSRLAHYAGHAEAFINAKISRKYTIPFTVKVPMLEVLATDLAIKVSATGIATNDITQKNLTIKLYIQ